MKPIITNLSFLNPHILLIVKGVVVFVSLFNTYSIYAQYTSDIKRQDSIIDTELALVDKLFKKRLKLPYEKGMNIIKNRETLIEQKRDSSQILKFYRKVAEIFIYNHDYRSVDEYIDKGLSILIVYKDPREEGLFYNLLGIIANREKSTEKEIEKKVEYFLKAERLLSEYGLPEDNINIDYNLALIHETKKDWDKTIFFSKKGLKNIKLTRENTPTKKYLLICLITSYLEKQDVVNAKKYIDEIEAAKINIRLNLFSARYYKLLGNYYLLKKDTKNAIKYLKESRDIYIKLHSKKMFDATLFNELRTDLINEELKNAKTTEINALTLHHKNKIIYLIFLIMLILIALIVFMYRSSRLLKKKNEELIKAKERAEKSDNLKTAFLINLSHEIRTPMNSIIGFGNLLQKPDLGEQEKNKYINLINNNGERLLNTINNTIAISKIESRDIDVLKEETDIVDLLTSYYHLYLPQVKAKGLHLNLFNLKNCKSLIVNIDKAKLDVIINKLIKNAIEFTEIGFIEFGCELKGSMLQFFVKDTGIGINAEHIDSIFEKFMQIDNSMSRSYEGSGLGLPICKAYVEIIGGRIWVKSKKNLGSSFYFTIPIATS